jgi:hypothetical protein
MKLQNIGKKDADTSTALWLTDVSSKSSKILSSVMVATATFGLLEKIAMATL